MNFIDDAFERLTKTAPDVVKYVSTFVDLTKDIPDTYGIELGVFLLMCGPSIHYIPVISKGGTIYPIDSVFDSTESKFFPLTPKFVEKLTVSNQMSLGAKDTIPRNADRNPNVRQLIEPPKTGKFSYASTGLSEFLYQLSEPSKQAFLTKLASDKSFGKGLHKVGFDINELKEVLSKPVEKQAEYRPVQLSVRVVTGGSNLPDTVVQEILQRGYGVVGYNTNPTHAIEYDALNDGYTKLSAAQEGKVYEVIFKDGSSKSGFVPKMAPNVNAVDEHSNKNDEPREAGILAGGVKVRANRTRGRAPMVIFEDGTHAVGEDLVIRATALGTMDDVIMSLGKQGRFVRANELGLSLADRGEYNDVMVVTKNGWLGPYRKAGVIQQTASGYTIPMRHTSDGDRVTIHQSASFHGDYSTVGSDIYVNDNAVFCVLSSQSLSDFEKDPALASVKRSAMIINHMSPVRIGFDGVEYSVNGKPIGNEAAVAAELLVKRGLSKQAFEYFVDKAKDQGKVDIYMSKQAAQADILPEAYPTPEGPYMPPKDNQVLPQAGGQGAYSPNFTGIQGAMITGDKSIIESTIISEFINDPNMFETIGTYLPDIREAIDKLGRSIFLIRLNINNLSDSIEPEYLSNLMSSLRNTYKMLGDTYMRMDTLSNTSIVEETEM